MKIELLFGQSGLTIDLPDEFHIEVVRKHAMPLLDDPADAVRRALARPFKSRSLAEIAAGAESACILICDITRPVPNGTLLPPLIQTLVDAGIKGKDILVLVATGLHRPNEGEELREIVGSEEVMAAVRVENHFARDRGAHRDLGETSSGIPIGIDSRFLDADVKIVTGLVEPHFMAGYSGGRKVVAPGIAYQDTILKFHTAHILEHPKAANCVLEGNPLHQAQVEIVRAIGGVLALNVVLDEKRRMGFVNFGDVEASHLEAVAFMRQYAEVPLGRRFKTVLTTGAGYPLDKTYYQTIKGMVGVLDILEPGGTVVIASECAEGMGSREFVEAQQHLCDVGPDRFMSALFERDKARIDEWQTEMLVKALKNGSIQLYCTGLSPEDLKHIYVRPVQSVEAAVAASVEACGDKAVAVVPEGPYVIPFSH